MTAWKRKVKRPYNPKTFREADAAVARLMKCLKEKADEMGLCRINGKWVTIKQ